MSDLWVLLFERDGTRLPSKTNKCWNVAVDVPNDRDVWKMRATD